MEERQYFEKFSDEISDAGTLTKENVRKTFLELKDSVNELSDEVLFNKILLFLEKKIDKDESLSMAQKDTKLISLKIKIFKKNLNTEKYKLVYGYLTTIAAETLGNFSVRSDKLPDYIGIELEKGNLTAKKGGNFVGMNMSGGSIHILENTGMFAGQRMSGGNIKIDGTARVCLGDGIRGGKIEAKMADKTANRSENVSVEKYTGNSPLQKIQETSLISNYDIERYAEEALKNINEWEKRNVIAKKESVGTLNNIDAGKEVSEEVSKETNSLKFEKVKQETGNLTHNFNEKSEEQNNKILLSNIMQEIYGKINVEKIEGIEYVRESERNINRNEYFDKIFVTGQKEEEKDRYRDENFERLKLLFEYKEANKDEILTTNLSINDIEKILNNITPLTLLEKTIIGYLTSVAAEKLAIRGEALIIEKNFDYIGIEMKNGKILVKNAGEYIGKICMTER